MSESVVLEKMAQAIRAAALSKRPDTWPPSWEFFANEARAAIEALAAHINAQVMSKFPGRDSVDNETWALNAGRELLALRAALSDGQKGGG